MKRCPVTNKISYPTSVIAFLELQALQIKRQRDGAQQIERFEYKCPHCPWWHLTRQPQDKRCTA